MGLTSAQRSFPPTNAFGQGGHPLAEFVPGRLLQGVWTRPGHPGDDSIGAGERQIGASARRVLARGCT